jgi:hypothetical protein
MDEALERLLRWLRESKCDTCGLIHVPKGASSPGRRTVRWDRGRGVAWIEDSPDREKTVLITIEGPDLSAQWYISLPAALVEMGVKRIELRSWGWWILDDPKPPAVWIVDHITCYLPGPLIGTDQARRGRAFMGMKHAYEESHSMVSGILKDRDGLRDGIVWHTKEHEALGLGELESARAAGCSVASPNIAPWAIGARAAGCRFAAVVVDPLETTIALAHAE